MRADGAGRSSRPQGEVSVLQAIDALNNEFAEEDFLQNDVTERENC